MNDDLKKIENLRRKKNLLLYDMQQNYLELSTNYDNVFAMIFSNLVFIISVIILFRFDVISNIISFISNPMYAYAILGKKVLFETIITSFIEMLLLPFPISFNISAVKNYKSMKQLRKKQKNLKFELERVEQKINLEMNKFQAKQHYKLKNRISNINKINDYNNYRNYLLNIKNDNNINADLRKTKIKILKKHN